MVIRLAARALFRSPFLATRPLWLPRPLHLTPPLRLSLTPATPATPPANLLSTMTSLEKKSSSAKAFKRETQAMGAPELSPALALSPTDASAGSRQTKSKAKRSKKAKKARAQMQLDGSDEAEMAFEDSIGHLSASTTGARLDIASSEPSDVRVEKHVARATRKNNSQSPSKSSAKVAGPDAVAGDHSAQDGSTAPASGAPSALMTMSEPIVVGETGDTDATDLSRDDIVKHNFEAVFPMVKAAIEDSDFIAIDGEFTGLPWGHLRNWYFDTPDERYKKSADAVRQLMVTQYGICTFKFDAKNNTYHAQPFNFFVFPRSPLPQPGADPNATPSFRGTKMFQSNCSSLEFLASNHFDFNKWIHDGITFMNHDESESREHAVPKTPEKIAQERLANFLTRKEPSTEVLELIGQVKEFLAGSEPSMTVSAQSNDDAYYLSLAIDAQFDGALQRRAAPETLGTAYKSYVLTRSTLEQREALVDITPALKRLHAMVGFRHVIDAISESKKPIVGHNCFLDILYTYQNFHRRLPDSFFKFANDLSMFLPKIYDTKLLATQQRRREKALLTDAEIRNFESMADAVYAINASDVPAAASDSVLAAASGTLSNTTPGAVRSQDAKGDAAPPSMYAVTWLGGLYKEFSAYAANTDSAPRVSIKQPGKNYLGPDGLAQAHEAAYDALMTGSIFVWMLHHMSHTTEFNADAAVPSAQPKRKADEMTEDTVPTAPIFSDSRSVSFLEKALNRTYCMQSDMPEWPLTSSPDDWMTPNRSQLVAFSNVASDWEYDHIKALVRHGLGVGHDKPLSINIRSTGSSTYIVELPNGRSADVLLELLTGYEVPSSLHHYRETGNKSGADVSTPLVMSEQSQFKIESWTAWAAANGLSLVPKQGPPAGRWNDDYRRKRARVSTENEQAPKSCLLM
ncbi:hypothetical protein CXG81DRAFT_20258 [Caulochytrium protostelioides]|uniref:CAF1-domain-containing protein n=1 Tax=Caulochytrium protostelioides TaxID=1555241 RepID=A0A4P9WZB1_9FUNG|nr:CAF1-domain-containing protein [Caulochytrium protostelioides]RKO99684.1 hypothetical protein CXG81DRAFT_20258 [Caulochytrium protostelioides]|eukprot:RKO99684.1 hypothetical protein CXG81DRAFT_20258 [Caulochytrium protostelioides]